MNTNAPDLTELKARLVDQLEKLAEELMGPPNLETLHRREWRWGSKGSASLVMCGEKRGEFFIHEGAEGGSVLDFITYAQRRSISDKRSLPLTIEWAKGWLGLDGGALPGPVEPGVLAERERKRAQAGAEDAADKARRVDYARALWRDTTPPGDTPAELYLTRTRAIPALSDGWPDVVRWHPANRALILAATTPDSAVQAVQRVYLTNEGQKIDKAEAEARKLPGAKQSNGVVVGAVVRLPGDPNGPLLLAEGPETGLSVWRATGYETWIALGSMPHHTPPVGRQVVICCDDDPRNSAAGKALRKAVDGWKAAGVDLVVATPWAARRGDKSDFNDTMKASGAEAVRARIAAALVPEGTSRRERLPIDAAREVVRAAIAEFVALVKGQGWKRRLQDATSIVHAIRADVGTSKSHLARHHAAELLAWLRSRGDPRTICIAVPTHRLAAEAAAAFAKLQHALTVAIWRGREAEDPDVPGHRMCWTPDRAREAREAGLSTERTCCRHKLPGGGEALCRFFAECGYQRQKASRPDLSFAPHDLLYSDTPTALGDLAALIVDETPWHKGLEGEEGNGICLRLDSLTAADRIPRDEAGTQRLCHLRGIVRTLLDGAPDGPLTRDLVRGAGITVEMAQEAVKLEERRRWGGHDLKPTQEPSERRSAIGKAATRNRTVRAMVLLWRALEALAAERGPQASGWVKIGRESDRKARGRVLWLKGRRPLGEGWQVPTLHLDATLCVDLLRPHWPTVELVADVAVEAPHQRIFQVQDSAFGKSRLIADNNTQKGEQRRRHHRLRDLHATIAAIGRRYAPGRVLVVAQITVEVALRALPPLPSNIETAHHNAVAGRDGWRDVAALVVVGRTAPLPAEVEWMAEALTGAHVEAAGAWYQRIPCARTMADGTTMPAEADRHPDPVAEAVRWSIHEGELVQIIGRGRGGNRGEENRVDVFVLTDAPLSMPIDAAITTADLAPPPMALMLAQGGIAFLNSADAAKAYDDLWISPDAAKMALHRARSVTFPYMSLEGEVTHLFLCRYQRPGPGKKPALALVDTGRHPDAAAALAAKLGPLAWCRPADVTTEAAPAL